MAKLIFVGGFLGAGKTTMLDAISKNLISQGKKVGLITNDQASELVDTAVLSMQGRITKEVSGSCFCCNFPGLKSAVDELEAMGVDVILAEPVGSCTDLSATIMQPVKDMMGQDVELAPLTVMVDPVRLRSIIDGGTSGLAVSAAYIVRKQLEESDIIVINKSDLLSDVELKRLQFDTIKCFPKSRVMVTSAIKGYGIDAWLIEILHSKVRPGSNLTEVDYDIYAEGEAVLGWLNISLSLVKKDAKWRDLVETYLSSLAGRFRSVHAEIGHVKLLVAQGEQLLTANLTGGDGSLNIHGLDVCADKVDVVLNARVEMEPAELERICLENLDAITLQEDIAVKVYKINCLKPGRPNPTYHYDSVVSA